MICIGEVVDMLAKRGGEKEKGAGGVHFRAYSSAALEGGTSNEIDRLFPVWSAGAQLEAWASMPACSVSKYSCSRRSRMYLRVYRTRENR